MDHRRIPAFAAAAVWLTGCYHFSFEQTPAPRAAEAKSIRTVTHEVRRPTYLNGFIGTGEVDTRRFCEDPVRTELRVTAVDVLLSVATVLIYTPHTLYVTCPANVSSPRVSPATVISMRE